MAENNQIDLNAMFQKAVDARGPARQDDGERKNPFQITVSINDEQHFHLWNALKQATGIHKNADLLVKLEELAIPVIQRSVAKK